MLVLSRKLGEKICIGDDVVIEIRRVAGNRVSVGVSAPKSLRVLRGELESSARPREGEQRIAAMSTSPLAGDGTTGQSTDALMSTGWII